MCFEATAENVANKDLMVAVKSAIRLERVRDVRNHIQPGKLWEAFTADGKAVLHGARSKNEQGVDLFERLAVLARR